MCVGGRVLINIWPLNNPAPRPYCENMISKVIPDTIFLDLFPRKHDLKQRLMYTCFNWRKLVKGNKVKKEENHYGQLVAKFCRSIWETLWNVYQLCPPWERQVINIAPPIFIPVGQNCIPWIVGTKSFPGIPCLRDNGEFLGWEERLIIGVPRKMLVCNVCVTLARASAVLAATEVSQIKAGRDERIWRSA